MLPIAGSWFLNECISESWIYEAHLLAGMAHCLSAAPCGRQCYGTQSREFNLYTRCIVGCKGGEGQ